MQIHFRIVAVRSGLRRWTAQILRDLVVGPALLCLYLLPPPLPQQYDVEE